jgi:hypothetical protein
MKFFGYWGAFWAVVLISCQGYCQIRNYKVFEYSEGSLVGEPTIAVNPRNQLNVVAASSPDNIFHSVDGGKSWVATKIKSPYGVFGSLQVICDSKGNFFLIHQSDVSGRGLENDSSLEVLVCHASYDGGKTWDDGTSFGFNANKDQVKPFAASDTKGNIWVTWSQIDKLGSSDSTCHSVIMLSSSSTGKKWSKPVPISQYSGSCGLDDRTAIGAMPGISSDRKVYVTWTQGNQIFLDRSLDGGSMWLTNDIVVAKQAGGGNLSIPGCDHYNGMPVLKLDKTKSDRNGLILMCWADQRNGKSNTDIFFSRSSNFGDIWLPAQKVNTDKGDSHQYMPAMCIDDVWGTVFILFYDRRGHDDDQTDVYLAYSRDSGTTFRNIKVSEKSFRHSKSPAGKNLSITSHNGTIIPIWTSEENDKTIILSAVINEADLPK